MPVLPKSRLVRVEMTIALPIGATHEEVEEWLQFELGRKGSMSCKNPLSDHAPEAISDLTLTDTERHLHELAEPNADGSYTITKWSDSKPAWGPSGIEQILSNASRISGGVCAHGTQLHVHCAECAAEGGNPPGTLRNG